MSRKEPIEIRINKNISILPESIYEAKVLKSGSGAVISSYKRFIGKKVLVIIIDKEVIR